MTIRVYRVDARTGERVQVRERQAVTPDLVPELSSRMPPCACPRCRRR